MPDTKIIFLILPHVHLLDLAGADQVFHEAIDIGADLHIEYCSIDENIKTSSHLPFGKLNHYSKIKITKGDYLFIPGAEVNFLLSKSMVSEKELIKWVKGGYENGGSVCTICTGAFFLAATGLLDGRKCTTHWKRTAQLQKKYPLINVIENILFTEDERIYTSAGVTAGIDMALYIVAKLKDDNFSFKVARALVVYVRRRGSESQQSIFMSYRNHIHSGVHKVQDYLQEHVHIKSSLAQLAEVACMSARNLTRVFKKETGISVNEYITLIRKERITELIKSPDITRKEIARQNGLKSERHVIRLLKNIGQ
jgi:transcriptional regulator GlxA family with amidase domain